MPKLSRYHLEQDPLAFALALGFKPDQHQIPLLAPGLQQVILCCHRGAGKTEIAALRAAHHARYHENALILVASETAEKAAELIQRAAHYLDKAGIAHHPDRRRKHGLQTENGARLLPLPARHSAVRGHAATMVIIDEAACVPDQVYTAIRGTRATTAAHGEFWVLSTPGPRSGFFYRLWTSQDPAWTRLHLAAPDNPRIREEFLEAERRHLHPDDFAREYLAEFGDATRALFRPADLRAAIRPQVPILGANPHFRPLSYPVILNDESTVPSGGFFFCVDLAQAQDRATLAVIEYALVNLHRRDPVWLTHLHDIRFRLRWLQEFPRDTPYTDISPVINKFLQHPEIERRATIILDATGAGRPMYDHFRLSHRGTPVVGIQITGGSQVTESGNLLNMPKQEMVLTLESLLRDGDLEISAACPFLDQFIRQMDAFERIRLPNGKYTYSGKASGRDDLVMAVAMGVGYMYHKYRWVFRRLREQISYGT